MLAHFPEIVKTGFEAFRQITARDATYGAYEATWSDVPVVTFDGVLRELRGDKRFIASVHGYNADYSIYTDTPCGVLVGDRIGFDARNYQVTNVDEDVMGAGELARIDMLWVQNGAEV